MSNVLKHTPLTTRFTTLMSPKKAILRELSRAHEESAEGQSHRRPSTITGFSNDPEKYQKAVNELLQARLVEGKKDDEGHMTIALNEHRIRDVKKELRPIWAHPALWAAVFVLVAIGAGLTIV